MHIKQIGPAERKYVTGLFDQYRVFYGQPSDLQRADDFLRERLENKESTVFAAFIPSEDGPVAAGFTQLYPLYSSVRALKLCLLNDLFVLPGYRSRGIGNLLIRAAIDFARENKAAFLQLETATDNTGAQKLYESIGFIRQAADAGFLHYALPLA